MADVIRIELSGAECRLIDNLLHKHLANITDHRLLPLDGCKEEYEKADMLARKLIRAEFFTPTMSVPQAEEKQQQPQPTPRPQQQEQRSPLPPLSSYQPQAPTASKSGAGHLISEKQSKRLYAIQMKSGKKQFEVKEYLKRLGFGSSKEITSDKYDEIINWVQN